MIIVEINKLIRKSLSVLGSIGLWKPRYCVLINNLFVVCRSSVKVDVTRQPPPDFKDIINVNDIDEVNSVMNQGTHIMEVLLGKDQYTLNSLVVTFL